MNRALRFAVVVAVAIACAFAATRIVTLHLADTTADDAPERALAWRPDHPRALLRQAERQLEAGQGDAAAHTARALLAVEPLEGRAFRVLAAVAEREGRTDDARALYAIAARRAPRDFAARRWLIVDHLQRREFAPALAHVDALLRLSPARGKDVHPILAQLAADPDAATALAAELRDRPPWRAGLMATLRDKPHARASDRVHAALQRNGGLDDAEFDGWLNALMQQDRWGEAYARWAGEAVRNGQPLTPVYNGRFAQEPTSAGFDWRTRRVPGVVLAFEPGKDGTRVAHARFRGHRIAALNLEQPLLLAPGAHRLAVRMRTQALRSDRGLEWTIACHPSGQVVARSERIDGTQPWATLATDFIVPGDGCGGQWLRLRNPAAAASVQQVSGELWLDDVAIAREKVSAGSVEPATATP